MSRAALIAAFFGIWTLISPTVAESIVWPRPGSPAIVIPGALLEFEAKSEGAITLESDGRSIPLEGTWSRSSGAVNFVRAVVPEGTAPGRYTLRVVGAEATAQRSGSVHVLETFPEDYAIAIVRGVKADEVSSASPVVSVDLGARLSAESVQLAILLSPLTHNGSEEEYEALEKILLASEVPVYLCPSAVEMQSTRFRKHFGDTIIGVTFGRDGYLFLGPGLAAANPQTHARLGEAHRLRRGLRASRWSVGVAASYSLDWDLRSQIALFVDDPLNFLIVGSAPAELGATLPWGKTHFTPPPGLPSTPLTVLEVTATGIRPRPQPEATEASTETAAQSEAQALAAE